MASPTLYKYHGLGNDFLITRALDEPDAMRRLAQRLCPRHTALGADGVLFWDIHPDGRPRMTIYNRDGSRPEMCGNGLRCLALFLVQHGHVERSEASVRLQVHTDAGLKGCLVAAVEGAQAQVTIEMGIPSEISGDAALDDEGRFGTWFGVDMGNPHAVVMGMEPLDVIDTLGRALNAPPQHPSFPHGVNGEFVHAAGPHVYDVVVFERGVGRTQACGTGACAVAWALWRQGVEAPEQPVTVRLPGGELVLTLTPDGGVTMKGPAAWVYQAQLPKG